MDIAPETEDIADMPARRRWFENRPMLKRIVLAVLA
ncbi:monofunctional biosynthetic peptidoglycan transglycosylase, partial [Pseudomonas sp. BGM005]|nr:monofunctional biosynthetic peptidoglycan transglycosylase [Pseudomonas sp. BG5]